VGAAAYRRGSRAISARIDRELEERRRVCGGVYRSGPDKAYARCDGCGRVDYEKYEGDKCSWPPRQRDNPAETGSVTLALAGLAVAGLAWLLLRPKPAQATPKSEPAALPSFVPETQPPLPPAPTKAPQLPKLNCAGKVFVTYKFKDAPPVINVFRRLTTWQQGLTPDQGGLSFEERVWALSGTTSFFNIGVLSSQGWLDATPFENHHKDAQILYVTKRYLAEAWVETTDGWCLAATDTNYEPWT